MAPVTFFVAPYNDKQVMQAVFNGASEDRGSGFGQPYARYFNSRPIKAKLVVHDGGMETQV